MLKILVIRNDKIGDFMLAWPSFALLKFQYPQAEITALVPHYTAPLAEQCEWIDKVLIDDKKNTFFPDIINLSKNIRQNNYDLSISLFSETRTSLALWLAGIKLRIGPATKIAQIFLNNTLRQKRSESLKPEYEYNLDLINHYINYNHDKLTKPKEPPYLWFSKDEINYLRNDIEKTYNIPKNNKIIIVHPGTGGSAINLSTNQYAELITNIGKLCKAYFIITAGPSELEKSSAVSQKIHDVKHHVHESKNGIINFCKIINACDLFISGSTGPLHIAGALNIPTVAFYPTRQSATSLRWETINTKENRLAFMPENSASENNLKSINIDECSNKIFMKFFKNKPHFSHNNVN
ncbi:ADP-heptose--lipooligosaccharide heptosyltransferase II [hydrothermal vent metagenome]|uniref:ADP-heptose--lipooligosaccharide heptosyltransferase II n=1 Tax=hydrothermal vent metagenome TaxID=652676 RepID=A0A3B0WMR7_9ZZZZ